MEKTQARNRAGKKTVVYLSEIDHIQMDIKAGNVLRAYRRLSNIYVRKESRIGAFDKVC